MDAGYKGKKGTSFVLSVISTVGLAIGLAIGIYFAVAKGLEGSGKKSSDGTPPSSTFAKFRFAGIATDTNICAPIGIDILGRQGGSAVDAAIATYLCVCVVNAHSCGIGGGFFATIYDNPKNGTKKEMTTITAREKAPLDSTEDMYVDKPEASTLGGLAVGVPGEVYGYYEAWKKFGKIPWKNLFVPVIKLCREGYKVERDLGHAIVEEETDVRNMEGLRELFVKSDGSLVQEGDLLINEKLAVTFERIADDPMTFYEGELANDIIEDLKEHGSIIKLEDLKIYGSTSVWKDPVKFTVQNGNYTFNGVPPPSSGVVLQYMFNILDGFNMNKESISTADMKALSYHRIAEAFKFAYAKRSDLGDNEFVDVSQFVMNMTSSEFGRGIRQQIIDNMTYSIKYYGPSFEIPETPGTSHMSLLSHDGSAFAITGTINTRFGSKVRGRRTGIIFNNEMDDFSTPGTINFYGVPASPSNYIEPGKRPMSSMSPSIVLNPSGKVVFISGGEGGTKITTSTALVMINGLWFDLDLKESTDTARIHHQLAPNILDYEHWLDKDVKSMLEARKHKMNSLPFSGVVTSVQNICEMTTRDHNDMMSSKSYCVHATSDGRKGGMPDGF